MDQSVPPCELFHNFMDMEKSVVQMFSWTMGIYGPRLFTTREETGKSGGKAFNALPSPANLMVMGKRWISRRILIRRFDNPPLSYHLGFLRGSFLLVQDY